MNDTLRNTDNSGMSNNDADYITNPKTNRPVKVGSRVYRKLVKEGLIGNIENESYDIDTEDQAIKFMDTMNNNNKDDRYTYTIKNTNQKKVIKQSKPLSQKQIQSLTTKASTELYRDIQEGLVDPPKDPEKCRKWLEKEIQKRMIGSHSIKQPILHREQSNDYYQLQEEDVESYSSEDAETEYETEDDSLISESDYETE